jgi:hypothetical protein
MSSKISYEGHFPERKTEHMNQIYKISSLRNWELMIEAKVTGTSAIIA